MMGDEVVMRDYACWVIGGRRDGPHAAAALRGKAATLAPRLLRCGVLGPRWAGSEAEAGQAVGAQEV